MASLRPLRLVRAFSQTARAASQDGGPAVKYNAFRRRNEADDTLRARLLCTSRRGRAPPLRRREEPAG